MDNVISSEAFLSLYKIMSYEKQKKDEYHYQMYGEHVEEWNVIL